MSLRDLGYRPYEGERLAPSHNTWVLLRYGLTRAWASWLVKLAAFFGWVPGAVGVVLVAIAFWIGENVGVDVAESNPGELVASVLWWQLWVFTSLVTLGAGAAAIAEDFTYKAFQFYFAKPVTAVQYLTGRVLAVAGWIFGICLVPSALVVLAIFLLAPPELRLEWGALIFPTLVQCLVIAAVMATVSVGVSALSTSRALTMSAWLLLLLVPHVVAKVVEAVGDFPWLRVASLFSMLDVLGDALLRVEREDAIRWYHAAIALALWVTGATTLALHRLRRAEVIT